MSGIVDKIFGSTAKEVTDGIGQVVDKFVTTDKKKLEAKNELTDIVMSNLIKAMELQAGIITAEAQGNRLQRNWRPVLMMAFGFIIIYRYFLAPVFVLPAIDLPDQFWDLLALGIGGYVIGRSVEKVTDKVVQNVDITFLKKKDRKT